MLYVLRVYLVFFPLFSLSFPSAFLLGFLRYARILAVRLLVISVRAIRLVSLSFPVCPPGVAYFAFPSL